METASSKSMPNLLRNTLTGIQWHLGMGATIREARMRMPALHWTSNCLNLGLSMRPSHSEFHHCSLQSSSGVGAHCICCAETAQGGWNSTNAPRPISAVQLEAPLGHVGQLMANCGRNGVAQTQDPRLWEGVAVCPIKDRCKGVQSNGWRLPTQKLERTWDEWRSGTLSDVIALVWRLIVMPAGEGGEAELVQIAKDDSDGTKTRETYVSSGNGSTRYFSWGLGEYT
ncbi:hypothetical protein EDB84DRAFT_1436470 [Lactarius hengduanensis]|nr:hypothetical protein EDB84DRAFT_1436470 [Lactarius hengduanensis]